MRRLSIGRMVAVGLCHWGCATGLGYPPQVGSTGGLPDTQETA